MLPPAFEAAMRAQLGPDYSAFAAALETPAPTSVRLHPQKGSAAQLPAAPDGAVPWHPRAYYLAERPSFTLDPAFHAGAYYVQEAGSMLVATALRQHRKRLGERPLRALDMCAAPGGKSTALLDELGQDDLLVANEVIQHRAGILRYNLAKWGRANVAVTNQDPQDFAGLTDFFDVVAVDAPCSGEGLFRRDPAARQEWSSEAVRHCALRQRRILQHTIPLLRPGGLLLYSTCTYNPSENEAQVAALVEAGFRHRALDVPAHWQLEERRYGYQCYPHRTRSEGFYMAVLQKPSGAAIGIAAARSFRKLTPLTKKEKGALAGQLTTNSGLYRTPDGLIRYLPEAHMEHWLLLDKHLRRQTFGTPVGTLKRHQLVPDAALALATGISGHFPDVAVDRVTALSYLRGEAIDLPAAPDGWVRLVYAGLGLGFAKKLPRRVNNYYPKGWRIRMR